jgi:hypothetical protein
LIVWIKKLTTTSAAVSNNELLQKNRAFFIS